MKHKNKCKNKHKNKCKSKCKNKYEKLLIIFFIVFTIPMNHTKLLVDPIEAKLKMESKWLRVLLKVKE